MQDEGKKCVVKAFFNIWAWVILVSAYVAGSGALLFILAETLEIAGLPPVLCAILFLVLICFGLTFLMAGCTDDSVADAIEAAVKVSGMVLLLIGIMSIIIGTGYLMITYLSPVVFFSICGVVAIAITSYIALRQCGYIAG